MQSRVFIRGQRTFDTVRHVVPTHYVNAVFLVLSLFPLSSTFYLCQPLTAMPECSQTPRRQRPDYLADFTSASSADNSCSSSDEDEEDRGKSRGGRGGEKKDKKVSYHLEESKDKDLAERSGRSTFNLSGFISDLSFIDQNYKRAFLSLIYI